MRELHISNRNRVHKRLPGALLIVTAYHETQMSNDMAFPFVQEANFWWLTGVNQPSWVLIFDGLRNHSALIRPRISKTKLVFDGALADDEIIQMSGVDEIVEEQDLEPYLRQLARKHNMVHTIYDKTEYEFLHNSAQRELNSVLNRLFPSVQECSKQIRELRAIKSETEIKLMRQAINLTCRTFRDIRANMQSYRHEYELEADFTRSFRREGVYHAYEPIVASGKNALTLHYVENNSRIQHNKLTLIDIGARRSGYCADITRTYSLKPTKRQREVHAAVEKAHHEIIALLGPGLLVGDYLADVDNIMKDALRGLGLLKNQDENETYRRYFPHAVSHGLGVDVHDSLGAPRLFVPGMVLTVEPGIYIPEEQIGVRIEDDILITATGRENMSIKLSTGL